MNEPAPPQDADWTREGGWRPRAFAKVVASQCGGWAQALIEDPLRAEHYFGTDASKRALEMFNILDASPDLPASAIVKHFDGRISIAAAEAFKATYVGMLPWVKAEEEKAAEAARLAKLAGTPDRPSRYEKTGRGQIKAGEKIGKRN